MSDAPEPTPAAEAVHQPPYDRVMIYRRSGRIDIAIWRKENDEGFADYSFTEPRRSYKDKKTGEYLTTTTLFEEDAAEVSLMYVDVRKRIAQHREADYQQRQQQAA